MMTGTGLTKTQELQMNEQKRLMRRMQLGLFATLGHLFNFWLINALNVPKDDMTMMHGFQSICLLLALASFALTWLTKFDYEKYIHSSKAE